MEIRKIFLSVFFVFLLVYNNAAVARVVSGYYAGTELSLLEDLDVLPTGYMFYDNIYVDKPIIITNNGIIEADINVRDGYEVKIQNSGTIKGSINLGNKSNLVQIVYTEKDLSPIIVNNGNYELFINNTDLISLYSIIESGKSADSIVLKDALLKIDNVLVIDDSDAKILPEVKLVGNTSIKIDDVNGVLDKVLLSNVSGDGTVRMIADNVNPLYVLNSYIKSGNLYAILSRETDYSKILKNEIGNFLNTIRNDNPNDKLLLAMDSATDMDELKRLMKKSVKLNPINLMKPISRFNDFEMLHGFKTDATCFSLSPQFIVDDNFYISGISIKGGTAFSDAFIVHFSLYSAISNYSDFINDFYAKLSGGNLRVRFSSEFFELDSVAGITFAEFNSGNVFDGEKIFYNPEGLSYYSSTRLGKEFQVYENFVALPFVIVNGDYINILNQSEINFVAGLGTDLNFAVRDFDIKYNYGIRFNLFTDGAFKSVLHTDFSSPFDGVGGVLETGIIYDDNSFSYSIKIGIDVRF